MFPIGVQLYSLRDMMQPGYEKEDFLQVLKWLAAIGYKGVQPAGFWGYEPREVRKIVEDLGMTLCSSHSPWARHLEDVPAVVDAAGQMGIDLVCTGYGPDDFKDLDAIKRTADKVNAIEAALKQQGLTLYLHNHYWEFAKVDGRIAYEIFAELAPTVKFEIDAYWSSNFGANDAAEMVARFKDRCVLLHMKDGTLTRDINMLPLGCGKLDIPAILKAADPVINQWVIVELDNCCIDMMNGIKMSYRYLTGNGLAAGNR